MAKPKKAASLKLAPLYTYVADLSDGRFEREIELNCDKLSLEASHDDFEHGARHLAEKGSKSCDEELMIFWKTNLLLAKSLILNRFAKGELAESFV